MRSVQITDRFPLSSVKPLESILAYRAHCIEATRHALAAGAARRSHSPFGALLEPFAEIDGVAYSRCPETGSLFLSMVPTAEAWGGLLRDIARYRQSPDGFHHEIAHSRAEHVHHPKVSWLAESLRLQHLTRPRALVATSGPSEFAALLEAGGSCASVAVADETALLQRRAGETGHVDVAVLLESLDRSADPAGLLRAVIGTVAPGGLVFITALVASGFDLAVLGARSLYLYPPDRTNCFTLDGLARLATDAGLSLIEVSTPGVLDVEIVKAHAQRDPLLALSTFEAQVIQADGETHAAFQEFLQQRGFSSFARIVARTSS